MYTDCDAGSTWGWRFFALTLLLLPGANAVEPGADPLAALVPLETGGQQTELGACALIIAHALDASVDAPLYAERLDSLASELKPALAPAAGVEAKLATIAEFVYTHWGFANRDLRPADVFVSFADAIDKRQWNCVSMSALYVALGERIGLPMQLVSGHGHVLVRCDRYYVETTQRGKVHDSVDYLSEYLPFPCLNPEDYKPVSTREAVAVLLTQTGGAVSAQGKLDFAQACFQHALKFDPDHAEAHAALGFHFAKVGHIDRAINAFHAAIRSNPKLREAYGGLGAALRAKGDLAKAAQALRKAVELCDKQPESMFNLGQVLYENGDLAASIEAFRNYTALAPGDVDGYIRLAFPLEDSGQLDEALAAYDRVLRLAPNHADALVNSGAILEKQNKWDAAQNKYERCIEAAPSNALAHAGMGRVLTERGDLDGAAKAFVRSIELDSTNPATWIDFARLERKRGDTLAAIEKLNRALTINPLEPETHIELADTLLDRGEVAKAGQHAAVAKRLGATLPVALESLLPETGENTSASP